MSRATQRCDQRLHRSPALIVKFELVKPRLVTKGMRNRSTEFSEFDEHQVNKPLLNGSTPIYNRDPSGFAALKAAFRLAIRTITASPHIVAEPTSPELFVYFVISYKFS